MPNDSTPAPQDAAAAAAAAEAAKAAEADADFSGEEADGSPSGAPELPKALETPKPGEAQPKKDGEAAKDGLEPPQPAPASQFAYEPSETEKQIHESGRKLDETISQANNQLAQIRAGLAGYKDTNWEALYVEDEAAYHRHIRAYNELKNAEKEHTDFLSGAGQQRSQLLGAAQGERIKATRQWASKNIPDWTPEMDQAIMATATSLIGFKIEDIRSAVTPQLYYTLYLANVGQTALNKPAPAPDPDPDGQAAPTKRVGGSRPAPRGATDSDDIETWMEKRNREAAG